MSRGLNIINRLDIYEGKSKRKNEKRKHNQLSPIADYGNDKKKVGRWTPEEDEKLQKLIEGTTTLM